jgi:photosystem II stability/assembly factor-like uncharacterized protein
MSILKTYYVGQGGNKAGVSYDSDNFQTLTGYNSIFSGSVPSVNVDPNNGNRVIFTGTVSLVDVLRVSTDSGTTFNTPGGDWSSNFINLNSNKGASISWLDSYTIIISGNNGIFKSTDGGSTFNYVVSTHDFATLYGDTVNVAKSYFSTENIGVLALSKSNGLVATKVYKTTDGGINWTLLSNYAPADQYTPVTDLWISTSGSKIIGVNKKGVFRSTNGGTLFTYPLTFSVVNEAGTGARLSNVSDTIFYASGGNAAIYKTINGGLSWTQQRIGGLTDVLYSLSFYNNTSGFVGIGSSIYKTTDSGITLSLISNVQTTVDKIATVNYVCGDCPDGFVQTAIDTCSGVEVLPDSCGPGFVYIQDINSCVGEGDCPPIDLYFVVDLSSSVSSGEVLQTIDLLNSIINYEDLTATPPVSIPDLLNADKLRIGLVSFGQNSPASYQTDNNYNYDLTSDAAVLTSNFATLTALSSSGTNTPLGLWEARERLVGGTDLNARPKIQDDPVNGAVKKIILITDGVPSAVNNMTTSSTPNSIAWETDTLGDASMATYVITNADDGSVPDITTGAGLASGSCIRTTPSGPSLVYSDCARCSIFARTMEIGAFLKTIDGININVSILAEVTGGKNWQTWPDLASYNFPGPSYEAVVTYKALIEGNINLHSELFPPSIDPASPYYISGGYQPTNPELNGNMNKLGLTGQDPAQAVGIPYGRLTYKPGPSTINYSYFSSDASGTWSDINSISATPFAYGTSSLNYIGFFSTGAFDPLGIWDCPDADPNYVPLCSKKADNTNDAYVTLFSEAADILAPALASSLCDVTIPVLCPEGCEVVSSVENANCECPQTLIIPACVYNIYDCGDLTTPLYCTNNDLSFDVGNVVTITIDGEPVTGCYKVGFSDKDYCDVYTDVAVVDTFLSCEECQPNIYKLTTCATESSVFIYTDEITMADYVDKVVVIEGYPKLCWLVTLDQATANPVLQTITVIEDYPDCPCCFDYQH